MYCNSLSVTNGEFSQHASMPNHLYPLKNNFKTLENIFFKISPSTVDKNRCSPCKSILLSLIIYINFYHSNHICINYLLS
jgi:hypothetical protein